jgi:hypothetical protein
VNLRAGLRARRTGREIYRRCAIELSLGECASTVAAEAPPNMEAYEFLLHGLELRSRFNWRDFLEARKMFRKALEHDEDYARAGPELGNHHYEAW